MIFRNLVLANVTTVRHPLQSTHYKIPQYTFIAFQVNVCDKWEYIYLQIPSEVISSSMQTCYIFQLSCYLQSCFLTAETNITVYIKYIIIYKISVIINTQLKRHSVKQDSPINLPLFLGNASQYVTKLLTAYSNLYRAMLDRVRFATESCLPVRNVEYCNHMAGILQKLDCGNLRLLHNSHPHRLGAPTTSTPLFTVPHPSEIKFAIVGKISYFLTST